MARLKTFSKSKWAPIAQANTGKTPRDTFENINNDSSKNLQRVIRGWYAPGGGGADELSTTGFLENETGKIISGVDTIPKTAQDTE